MNTASRVTTVAVLTILIGLAAVASVVFGARDIALADALSALTGATDTVNQAAAGARIPRTVMAVAIGAALAVSGTTMQAVTRNPLADPGIFGVLSGASLAVVIGITFFGLSQRLPTMIVAVVGSAAAAVFVYAVGSLGRGGATPPQACPRRGGHHGGRLFPSKRHLAAPRPSHGPVPVLADRRSRRSLLARPGHRTAATRPWLCHLLGLRLRDELAGPRR